MSVETITTISPITNKPILTRNGVSAAGLKLLPEVATEAFLSFRKTTLADRQAIVKKALKLLGDKQDILAKELTEQMELAAQNLQFEKAATLRDQIEALAPAKPKTGRVPRGR